MSVCVTLVRAVLGDAPVVPIKIMQDGGCVQGVVGVPLGGVWWLVPAIHHGENIFLVPSGHFPAGGLLSASSLAEEWFLARL